MNILAESKKVIDKSGNMWYNHMYYKGYFLPWR